MNTRDKALHNPLSALEMNRLGTYNAEKARGIMHLPDWVHYMEGLQATYDNWIHETLPTVPPSAP